MERRTKRTRNLLRRIQHISGCVCKHFPGVYKCTVCSLVAGSFKSLIQMHRRCNANCSWINVVVRTCQIPCKFGEFYFTWKWTFSSAAVLPGLSTWDCLFQMLKKFLVRQSFNDLNQPGKTLISPSQGFPLEKIKDGLNLTQVKEHDICFLNTEGIQSSEGTAKLYVQFETSFYIQCQ